MTCRILPLVVTALITAASTATAQNALTAIAPPAERPYPYEILGLQPGDPLADVTALFANRSEAVPTGESQTVRVQSPDGAVFAFTYDTFTRIGDVGVHGRMAKAPQDTVTATLATEVLEKRPMALSRSIRQPSDELPDPLALRAQIEETYGPPSRVEISGTTMTLTYAWSTDSGFIPDLDAQPKRQVVEEDWKGTTRTRSFRTCDTTQMHDNDVTYRFHDPREKELKPGCLATFTVSYRGEPGFTSIGFSLVDYELGRIHRDALDRQIIDALTGGEVTPSDMDL